MRINTRGPAVGSIAGNMSMRCQHGAPGSVLQGTRRSLACALIVLLALLQGLAPLLHAHVGRDVGPAGLHLYGLSALHGPDEAPAASGLACSAAEPPAMVAKAGCRTDEAPALVPANLAPLRFAANLLGVTILSSPRSTALHGASRFSTFLAQAPPAVA